LKKYDIQAFLDRELSEDKLKELCAHMQREKLSQLYYDTIAYQKLILKRWWHSHHML
jgi:hypothetical protein